MPTLPFTPENKTESVLDFPRLKLEMQERKRILCLADPTFGYVHTLRAPKIVNGQAEFQKVKQKDGSYVTEMVKDFVGRPLCLGDLSTLQDKGIDPQNCPACKRATETDEVDKPQRRFAMSVIVYNTKPGSFDISLPFGVNLVVWNFTDMNFNKLVDITSEWGSLREHDLLLGPCENKVFQKYEIAVAKSAAWKDTEERAQQVVACFRENSPKDLDALIGRKVEKSWMVEDLNKVSTRWRIANGGTAGTPVDESEATASLAEGLDSLLNTTPNTPLPASTTQQPAEPAGLDLGDIFTKAVTTSQAPDPATPAGDTPTEPQPVNFASLLDSLG